MTDNNSESDFERDQNESEQIFETLEDDGLIKIIRDPALAEEDQASENSLDRDEEEEEL